MQLGKIVSSAKISFDVFKLFGASLMKIKKKKNETKIQLVLNPTLNIFCRRFLIINGDLHYRLNFNFVDTNEIFYCSSKKMKVIEEEQKPVKWICDVCSCHMVFSTNISTSGLPPCMYFAFKLALSIAGFQYRARFHT